MDSNYADEGCIKSQMSKGSIKNGSSFKSSDVEPKSNVGPAVVFLWVWNWFTGLPKTVTNLYADFKSGELLARFTLLDAMLQFIVAVATSCHPQEESEIEEHKINSEASTSSKNKKDVPVFGGTGRTLRPRTGDKKS